jgi:hypothetical protein
MTVLLAPLVVVLVVLAVLVATAWAAVRRRDVGESGDGGPVCGACSYSTLGLASLTCPECGGDLRAVGIITPRTPRPRLGFGAACVAFTAALAAIAAPLSGVLVSLLPPRVQFARTCTLSGPPSRAYAAVTVRAAASGWGGLRSTPAVEMALVPGPLVATRPATMSTPSPLHLAGGNSGDRPVPARPDAVLDWLRSAGIDTGDPRVAAEAWRVAAAAREVGRPPWVRAWQRGGWGRSGSGMDPMGVFASVTFTESGSVNPPAWATAVILGTWGPLWLLGLRSLWRMTRARMAQPTNPH